MEIMKYKSHRVELLEENGKFIARAFRAAKNAKGEKKEFGFFWNKDEHRQKFVIEYLERVQKEDEQKEKVKMQQQALVNPFKGGEILYDSWGYDQTNVDFYQVVKVGAKSVKVREVAMKNVGEAQRGDYGYCEAVKDSFVSEKVSTKILKLSRDGKNIYVGDLSIWDGQPKYYSWGR
jgi:hypothetical protein